MDLLIEFIAGVPALLLARPWLVLLAVVLLGGGYLIVMKAMWRAEDRRDARQAARRHGIGER